MNVVRRAAILIATIALVSACSVTGLSFRADHRVKILVPRGGQEVSLPLTLRWSARHLAPGTNFAVFLDRAANPPRQRIDAVVDDQCRRTPGCPNPPYLEQHGIYVTPTPSLALETLPATAPGRHHGERHEVVIVLIDSSTGKRLGDASFGLEFFLKRGLGPGL